MRVYRGRGATVAADRTASERVVETVAADRDPAVRVWRPPRHVAFGRRDATEPGYEAARSAARDRGFPPVEREVGGRAVAYTGSTVAFARVVPIDDPRSGLGDRYDAATADLQEALAALGVDIVEGEPPDAFCPGSHSLQTADGAHKLVGLAQRVHSDVAAVAGVLPVADHDAIAGVLAPVYDALGVPFDPVTVGSVARAGSDPDPDPDRVLEHVESALVGDRPTTVRSVDATE
jgi:lipoate-protein ligase A